MKRKLAAVMGLLMLSGCAASSAEAALNDTSTGKASVEKVTSEGAVLKTNENGKNVDVSVNNDDHIVVIRKRKTISPASLIPGEEVEITYTDGSISAICAQGNK